jgi:hypothetical protein
MQVATGRHDSNVHFRLVWVGGFEPPAPGSQGRCATATPHPVVRSLEESDPAAWP